MGRMGVSTEENEETRAEEDSLGWGFKGIDDDGNIVFAGVQCESDGDVGQLCICFVDLCFVIVATSTIFAIV